MQIELVAAYHAATAAEATAIAEPQPAVPTATRMLSGDAASAPEKPLASDRPAADAADAVKDGVAEVASKASDHDGEQQLAVREHLERFKYYPASARRRGIAGDVEVAFHLRPDGMAEQVLLLASSGYEILDQAALETVNRAQPFPAAGGQYQFRLRFRKL